MVLLHVLSALQNEFQWRLSVGYFNHQLRGKADELDQRLIHRYCRKRNIPFHQGIWNKSRTDREGLSLEMSARSARHAFLGGVAIKKRAMVVMAHHADDQLELFLMRLFRGAGGEGLGGMRSNSVVEGYRTVALVRPLLEIRKQSLIDYATCNEVDSNEDSSNRNIDLERNLVRHRILPYLQKHWGKGLHSTCLRTMKIVSMEHSFAEQTATTWLANERPTPFAKLHTAVQRQIVRIQMIKLGVFPEFNRIEELRTHIGRPISVPKNRHIMLTASGKLSAHELTQTLIHSPMVLKMSGRVLRQDLFGGNLIVTPTKKPSAFRDGTEFFDADKIGGSIRIRNWRSGDCFQPIGMKNRVKLQDLFMNKKIPRHVRHQLLIAENEKGDVFWVEGLRIGEVAKTDAGTKRYLKWHWARS